MIRVTERTREDSFRKRAEKILLGFQGGENSREVQTWVHDSLEEERRSQGWETRHPGRRAEIKKPQTKTRLRAG